MIKNKLNLRLAIMAALSLTITISGFASANGGAGATSTPDPTKQTRKTRVYKDFEQSTISERYVHSMDLSKIMVVRPAPQVITSNVKLMRMLNTNNGYQNRPHKGTDFGSPVGTQIKAVSDGLVIFNKYNASGFGYYTGVEHPGGFRTLYAHLSSFTKDPGETVKAGEVIGISGKTGNITGPHLHFEVTYNNFTIDPFPKDGDVLDYGDGLPRLDYGYPTDDTGRTVRTNIPMPIIKPITTFDCSSIEVSNYMSQLNYSNPKGMSNIPSVIEIEPAILKSKEIEYGKEANECLTIFNDGSFQDGIDSAKGLWDKMNGLFSDPVGTLTKAGQMAADRAKEMYTTVEKEYKKGICRRLNSEGLKQMDKIDHAVSTYVAGGSNAGGGYVSQHDFKKEINMDNIKILAGEDGNVTREDLVANHFTYLVVQNMMGKGSKDVNSILQMDSKNYSRYLERFGIKFIEGKFDDLEDIIFGK